MEELYSLIEKVKATQGDPEAAHGYEDQLHIAFVNLIANYMGEHTIFALQEMANRILEIDELDFPRWVA